MRRLSLGYAFALAVLVFQVVWLLLLFHALNPTALQSTTETRTRCECAATPSSVPTDHTQHGHGTSTDVNDCTPSTKPPRQRHYLVVIVLSGVDQQKRRDSLRVSWMSMAHSLRQQSVKFVFSVGTLGLSEQDNESLRRENDRHHDMLLISDLKESYYNLTRKLLYSLVWADSNLEYSYLMKCDDDTFVWLEPLVKELEQRDPNKSLYWGFFDGRATAKKKGKWVEQDWYLCDKYLPYALGGGYVISSDLVHRVAVNADGLQLYNAEDVSMGVWLSSFTAERSHDVRFNTEFVSRGCNNRYLVSHKQTIEDIAQKHENLQLYNRQCKSEYQVRLSYVYDWSVPPSKCCERRRGVI